MVLYIDVLLFVNLVADTVILWLTARLLHLDASWGRVIFAIFLSVLYGFCVCLPTFSFLLTVFGKLLSASVIVITAFGFPSFGIFLRRLCVFLFVSLIYSGSLMLFSYLPFLKNVLYVNNGEVYFDLPVTYILLISIALCAGQLISERFFSKRIKKNTLCHCYIEFNKKSLDCLCLCDSGNLLTEKISGLPVAIIESDVLKEIVDLSDENASVNEALKLRRRFIPYKSADGKTGLLRGFLPDVFKLDGIRYKAVVAEGSRQIDGEGVYHGIVPIFERGNHDRVQTDQKAKRNKKQHKMYGARQQKS